MTEILFVHGALVRDGAWWWRHAAERVQHRTGAPSRAVALPSCGETDAPAGSAGLLEDAAALHRALDEVEGTALVVGHSYGGTVIAEGAAHPAVAHLLHISSYLPDVGSSQGGIMADERDPVSIAPGSDGTVRVAGYDERSFAARFLQDVADPGERAGAWSRVVPQSASAFVTPTTRAAWQDVPSTYLVCADDRTTSVELQRAHAARATHRVELPTGHHPFLSQPDLVADEIVRILASAA
ncbi:alpha/beta fold hydrolase [Amnibacterium setariae]|uniref:Alpha/beta hydrolase n=1 Tax=Amnibacterium setariae TaxID=2306585 RepID=A0A3A1U6S2_9MICO|nr:alpha/beta hydrolase [Amnibacterium setariae]RIX28624.1 alpha/beta hydrolase [Amnibacterium setariae]